MPRLLRHVGPPVASVLAGGTLSMKCSGIERALRRSHPWVRDLISELLTHCRQDHPHTVADVKFWPVVEVGQICALPGWHYDCVRDFDDPHPHERHLLYQWGAGAPTEFRGYAPREGDLVQYGRDLHRAVTSTRRGPRLLVRVTQSHIYRPRGGTFEPTTLPTRDP